METATISSCRSQNYRFENARADEHSGRFSVLVPKDFTVREPVGTQLGTRVPNSICWFGRVHARENLQCQGPIEAPFRLDIYAFESDGRMKPSWGEGL